MRTTYRIRQPYQRQFLSIVENGRFVGTKRPEHFIKVMRENRGSISAITGFPLDGDGLEKKNPLIAALGDSVTAGHFEGLLPKDAETMGLLLQKAMEARQTGDYSDPLFQRYNFANADCDLSVSNPPIEITDVRESYVEKFRAKLIDRYETTSVSTVNSGIAGDNMVQMAKRLDRDVIRYQPDLVLINGSLNWDASLGTTAEYKELLRGVIRRIRENTEADIVLITPNGDLPNDLAGNIPTEPTTPERVAVIRELAVEEDTCLADARKVWDEAKEAGIPWKELLANGVNHPSVEGHEVYARVLMQLFD